MLTQLTNYHCAVSGSRYRRAAMVRADSVTIMEDVSAEGGCRCAVPGSTDMEPGMAGELPLNRL